MTQPTPEGQFYSHLYLEPGAPKEDSARFRSRLAAFFSEALYYDLDKYGKAREIGQHIRIETGHQGFDHNYFSFQFKQFFENADFSDVFTGVTIIWRVTRGFNQTSSERWQAFVDRALKEENLKYRIDAKGGIHPLVDQEFARSRVSVIASLADARYAAVQHAVDAAFEQLNNVPMDGKGAARNIFEGAESLAKIITGSNSALTEAFVDRELRSICNRLFNGDAQLSQTANRLLSSFGKWVDALHTFRHGHDRDQPLVLPDDLAVLAVSQGAGFIRWLVDLDRRQQKG